MTHNTNKNKAFADALQELNRYTEGDHNLFSPKQLHAAANKLFAIKMRVNWKAIEKWFNPDEAPWTINSWVDLLLVLAVLRAKLEEVNHILAQVRCPLLEDLRAEDYEEQQLLDYWLKGKSPLTSEVISDTNSKLTTLTTVLKGKKIPPIANLPISSRLKHHPNPHMKGRSDEILQIAHLLSQHRGVIIIGEPGIGKTQVAVQFAHYYGQYFTGGVFFVSCANRQTTDAEIAACGGREGMNLPDFEKMSQREQVAEVYRFWSGTHPCLILLDNVDVTSAEEVEMWLMAKLPATGNYKVLITSTKLIWTNLLPFHIYELTILERHHSVAMLQEIVPELDYTIADQLAEKLGDFPLALYAAGTYLAAYPLSVLPEDYLAQLEHNLPTGINEYTPNGHILSLEATLDIHFRELTRSAIENEMLSERDRATQRLLAYAAYLSPGLPIPTEIMIVYMRRYNIRIEDALRRAAELGLLRYNKEQVEVHQLVALFLRRRLPQPEDLWMALLPLIKFEHMDRRLRWELLPELGYLSSKLREQSSTDAAIWCAALGSYMTLLRDAIPGRELLKWALAVQEEHDIEFVRRDLATTCHWLGMNYGSTYELDIAEQYFLRARELREFLCTQGDSTIEAEYARTLNSVGYMHLRRGRLQEAESCLSICLALYQKHNLMVGVVYNNLGLLKLLQSPMNKSLEELNQIENLLDTGLSEKLKSNSQSSAFSGIWSSYLRLGLVNHAMGQTSKGDYYFEQAIEVFFRDLRKDHPGIGIEFFSIGQTLKINGYLDLATICFAQAKKLLNLSTGEERDRFLRFVDEQT